MSSIPKKAPLTDAEKKSNHLASEQKRRVAIREGFDRLCRVVPNMEGQGRSEAVVLQATVKFMEDELSKKEHLRARAQRLGISDGDFEHMYREEATRRASTNGSARRAPVKGEEAIQQEYEE